MAEKKKKFNLKLKVAKVEPEMNPDGIVNLRMTLETEKGEYVRGVKLEDWEDPRGKRSIVKHWINSIGELESRKELSDEVVTAKAKKFVGEELKDE